MKPAVVTINCNDVLSDNARQSFRAAADRWGADYVELTEEHKPPEMHPMLVKLKLFDLVPAERIFYIDGADAIIRADAPSPFAVCPPSYLGVVKNAHRREPNYCDIVAQERAEWSVFNAMLNESLPHEENYFNAGVMIMTRSSHAALSSRAFEDKTLVGDRVAWIDQTPLNFAAARARTPILLLDETWNYTHPEQMGHWDFMEHYVYHFAGAPERKTVIPSLDWRMPPTDDLRRRRKPEPSPVRKIRFGRLREFVRRLPGVNRPARYLYRWLTLPQRVSQANDWLMDIERRLNRIERRLRASESEMNSPQDHQPATGDPGEKGTDLS